MPQKIVDGSMSQRTVVAGTAKTNPTFISAKLIASHGRQASLATRRKNTYLALPGTDWGHESYLVVIL